MLSSQLFVAYLILLCTGLYVLYLLVVGKEGGLDDTEDDNTTHLAGEDEAFQPSPGEEQQPPATDIDVPAPTEAGSNQPPPTTTNTPPPLQAILDVMLLSTSDSGMSTWNARSMHAK